MGDKSRKAGNKKERICDEQDSDRPAIIGRDERGYSAISLDDDPLTAVSGCISADAGACAEGRCTDFALDHESSNLSYGNRLLIPTAELTTPVNDYFKDLNELDKSFSVFVHEPTKSGEGMSSYYVYRVDIESSTLFENETPSTNRMSVQRRFSDFVVLHDKLVQKYQHLGRIVPSPPSKDALGTAFMLFQNREKVSDEFLNRRRLALRRFLIKLNRHPVLRLDEDFKHFLNTTSPYQQPSISTLAGGYVNAIKSGAGGRIQEGLTTAGGARVQTVASSSADVAIPGSTAFRKIVTAIQSGISKIVHKIDEPDMYFDELQQNVDGTLSWLRKLARAFENLTTYRKRCAASLEALKKSVQTISNCEQSSSICRSLSYLSQCLGKVQRIYQIQADVELYVLAETVEDYVALYTVVKHVLEHRMRILMSWKAAEDSLKDKRNSKLRLELGGEKDRIPQAELDVIEHEVSVDRYKENFDNISAVIRSEMSRFDLYKVHDLREAFVVYAKQLQKFYITLSAHWNEVLSKIED